MVYNNQYALYNIVILQWYIAYGYNMLYRDDQLLYRNSKNDIPCYITSVI